MTRVQGMNVRERIGCVATVLGSSLLGKTFSSLAPTRTGSGVSSLSVSVLG